MKSVFRGVIRRTASNPIAWWLYGGSKRLSSIFGRIHGLAQSAREEEFIRATAHKLFPNLAVAHGPFKNLRYASAESVASALLPKLLGSYESELHPVLEELLTIKHSAVVDIGCAEGYYAIGLALRESDAEVYAFDLNPYAWQACAQMAKLNNVADRVHVRGLCDQKTLRSIQLGERALIVSDCEGYESTLFTREIAEYLEKHDLIIETHDAVDIETSARVRAAFAGTHDIRSIRSVDDFEKAHSYRYPELDSYGLQERHRILREQRANIMEWLVMTSRRD
jgi:precorrin-6B methylase 2